jgi:hypothetical protein
LPFKDSIHAAGKAIVTFAGGMSGNSNAKIVVLIVLAASRTFSSSAPVPVPNHSFETPPTSFYSVLIDSWQKTPKPDWYVQGGGFTWEQLTGAFGNTATNSPDHISNCDSNQAIWLFAVPEVGLFQDYNSMDLDDVVPSHAFDAVYEVGKSYELTVGLFGGGAGRNYGMLLGVTLELGLYFRDAASNRVMVASTTITNSNELFPNNTNLVDFTVQIPIVKASDPWAGQHIGILMLSTVSSNMQGGYWDLDNVRLTSAAAPTLTSPAWSNNQFQFTLVGESGWLFEVLAATNATSPLSNWFTLGTLTNTTGTIPFVDTNADFHQRFYRARQLP